MEFATNMLHVCNRTHGSTFSFSNIITAAYALIFLQSAVPVKQPITKHRFGNNYYNFSLRLLRSGKT